MHSEQDIVPVTSTLLYPPGSSEQCQQISIIDDGVREDVEEEFTVTLTSGDSDVVLQPDTAVVLIVDNDSKYIEQSMICSISTFSTAISVEFDQNSYEVEEGGNVSVCVVLLGETDQPVVVMLTSQQGTATGQNILCLTEKQTVTLFPYTYHRAEGDDYESVSVELTFSGDSAMEVLCHSVSPVDDTVVENEEVFTLSLSTSESLVTIPIGSAVLRITDNDGRYRLRSFDIQNFNNLFRYVL